MVETPYSHQTAYRPTWGIASLRQNTDFYPHVENSCLGSEGQEKYLRELSITPVGYFTGAIKNHSPVRGPTGTILHGENEVFQRNRNDFPQG
jgi:hypothetical protein